MFDDDRLFAAVGFRCRFEAMGLDVAIDAVSFASGGNFGEARLIGNNGAANLLAVRGFRGVSFIEITPSGSVNLLTVYSLQRSGGGFEAVYSRHVGVGLGTPIARQDEGPCRDV